MEFRPPIALVIMGLVLLSTVAVAQEPPKKPVDPIIEEVGQSLSQEGIQARQLRAIKALAEVYEREKATLAAEREWWAGYLKGLEVPK